MDFAPPQLSFAPLGDDAEFPGFLVEVRAEGFGGSTEVWIARADLNRFLDALDALDATLHGEARLTCGWVPVDRSPSVEDTDLDLVIRPDGHAGRLQVDVTARASSRWVNRNSAHIVFGLPEPNALTGFRRALRDAANDPSNPPAVLSPDFREADV
jgi:hypothetical protein